ncbi:MAG: hypothetical protein IPG89_18985 [Bacteroidetes bacterium]|nr:hypothetical protein [Bacteroidota bacterium]
MKSLSILSLAFFGLISFSSKAQFFTNTVFNRKAAYIELFGTGIGATANYEYLYKDNGIKQGIKGGAGYFADLFDANQPRIVSGNLEYITFAGSRQHQIEAGLGLAFQYKYYQKNWQSPTYYISNSDTLTTYTDHQYKFRRVGPAIVPRIGYRYQTPDGGLVLRVAYTPLLYFINTEKEFYDGELLSKKSIPFQTKMAWGGISIGFSFY